MNDIISRKEVRGCWEYNLDTMYYLTAQLYLTEQTGRWYVCLTYRVKWFAPLQIKREIFEWRQLLKHLAFIKKKDILFALLIM